jgi:flagellar protein FlgJ
MSGAQIQKLFQAAAAAAPVATKLKKATQDIEAIFVKDLLSAMRKTAPKQALGGQSLGAEMYQDIFDQAIAEASAKNGTLGIAKTIYRQMAPLAINAAVRNAGLRPVSHSSNPLQLKKDDLAPLAGPEGQETHRLKTGETKP